MVVEREQADSPPAPRRIRQDRKSLPLHPLLHVLQLPERRVLVSVHQLPLRVCSTATIRVRCSSRASVPDANRRTRSRGRRPRHVPVTCPRVAAEEAAAARVFAGHAYAHS